MAMFIQNDATGAGAGSIDPNQAAIDLGIIANGDTGLGLAAQVGNQQQVTYAPSLNGAAQIRLNTLVNTNFTPNYGGGAQAVNIIIIPALANFVLNDGRVITNVGGTALPPQGSGLAGDTLNNTNNCLVIYDTTQSNGAGYCTARNGSGGTLDLPTPNPVILYHELSHAFRIVNNNLLALTVTCNPSSPEENAAINDENVLRTQIANATGSAIVLRDPGIHCGTTCNGGGTSCCIIASMASGSPLSQEVVTLRAVRDRFLRKSEIGFCFFQKLHHDYYSFSPQVCTMMARSDNLESVVFGGYVRPLVLSLRLLQGYALEGLGEEELGHRFAEYHPDLNDADGQLLLLRRANEYFTKTNEIGVQDIDTGIADLLEERAWSSAHVRWALIEPIRIYASALELFLRAASPQEIGRMLQTAFTAWAASIPLDQIWASLSERELKTELKIYEDRLLRTKQARAKFRGRLRQQFGHITSVIAVTGATENAIGGADG